MSLFQEIFQDTMEVTSCEIETKYKFKIKLDLKNIDKEYTVKDGAPFLASSKHFTATFENGNQFRGKIVFTDQKYSICIILGRYRSRDLGYHRGCVIFAANCATAGVKTIARIFFK